MSVTVEELIWELKTRGADGVTTTLRQIERQTERTGQSAQQMGNRFNLAGLSLTDMLVGIQAAIAGVREMGQVLAAVTGIGIAARFQTLNVGFTTLIGNAEKARTILKELRQLGAETPFDTEELVSMSRLLLAMGVDANRVVRDMRAITDAIAVTGQGPEVTRRVITNLSQVRGMQHVNVRDLNEIAYAGLSLNKILGAALGKTLTDGQGRQAVNQMTGKQFYDTFIKGVEKLYGGSARLLGLGTLAGILQNIGDTLRLVMLPTGVLLLPVVQAVGRAFLLVANAAQKLNEMTGGSAGLILLFRGLIAVKGVLITAIVKVRTSITGLIESLDRLSVSAATAAGSTGVQAAANATGTATAVGVGAAAATGGILARLRGFFSGGLKGVLSGAKGLLKGPGIGLIADLGLNWLGGMLGGALGGTLKGAGTGIGVGSLGFLGGGPLGIITTIVGALIGGITGFMGSRRGPGGDTAAEKLGETNTILKDIKAQMIGGGPRARRITSELEIEMALGRALKTGFM